MELIDQYFAAEKRLHEYFNYRENWKAIPIIDYRDQYWYLAQALNGHGELIHHDLPFTVDNFTNGIFYCDSIYTQRFLKQWVFRKPDFTMVSIDTHTDGNKFLAILDNSREQKLTPELEAAWKAWKQFLLQSMKKLL